MDAYGFKRCDLKLKACKIQRNEANNKDKTGWKYFKVIFKLNTNVGK